MKKLIFLLLAVLVFNCTPSNIISLVDDLKKNYQVGLRVFCNDALPGSWYCVSENEYDRVNGLQQSCETITITGINGVLFSGVLGSDSLLHSTHDCI
jgi:hypothetical protein